MKAYTLKKTGKPAVLKLRDHPEQEPGNNEVTVKISHIGINYAEILSRKGLYGWAPRRPYIPGMEATGIIEATGPGVDTNPIGEMVNVGAQYGCYAEKIIIPQEQALPAMTDYSAEENAAFLVNYMTAYVALFSHAKIRPDEKLLITAAAGGVGTAAVQLASKFGAEVYAMAGNDEKLELVRQLGACEVINYRRQNWHKDLEQKFGKMDVVFEMVGGKVYNSSLELLNPFGRMAVVGFASLNFKIWNPASWLRTYRDIPRAKIGFLAERSISVMASHLGYLLQYPDLVRTIYDEMTDFVSKHAIRPVIGKVFGFEQLPQAHQFIESRQSTGKVIVNLKR